MNNSLRGSVGKGQMSISREMGNLDEQLQNLRDAVKREREKRGGGRIWKSSERSQKGGMTVRRTSVLQNRLPVKREVAAASSTCDTGSLDFDARPASAEVTDTLQRIQAFDLFQGAFSSEAPKSAPQTDTVAIEKAKATYMQDFKTIETYKYDEDEEARRFQQQMHGTPSTPTTKKTVRIESPTPPTPSPPPEAEKKPKNHRGGIWSAYDVDARGSKALQSWGKGTAKKKPDNKKAARISELQNILLSAPPADGDTGEHQEAQRLALLELQRIQKGDSTEAQPSQPAWTYKNAQTSKPKPEESTADQGGGGLLLQGEYNETENRRQFEEAIRVWRTGDKPKQATSTKTTASAAIGSNTPVTKPLNEAFLSEYEKITGGGL
eukprot:TRINITY_DN6092_c1_g2_i3.p1 TRINITY_DN6092_c1_g2~~TRINITY_DN6092_c1_g2_i3.p1  ORF type:complete len:380 (+),score=50.79 TRINITY_DN6092_c1_g2_i3:160-1299(+)